MNRNARESPKLPFRASHWFQPKQAVTFEGNARKRNK